MSFSVFTPLRVALVKDRMFTPSINHAGARLDSSLLILRKKGGAVAFSVAVKAILGFEP